MRLGILGGTFDPIHNGHLRLAIEAKVRFGLDRVIFLPTPKPDHRAEPVENFTQRCTMVAHAIKPLSFCMLHRLTQADTCEARVDKLSKSCHAIVNVRQHYDKQHQNEQHDYFFILGEDSFLSLPQWHHAEQLVEQCKFLVFQRPPSAQLNNQDTTTDAPVLALLGPAQDMRALLRAPTGWTYVNAPLLDISASYVRACLSINADADEAPGLSCREHLHGLVPDRLLHYIQTHGLYGTQRLTDHSTQTG